MRRVICLSLLPLMTACGVISHNIAENMTESNRLEMLQGMKDDQLCSGYNNHLVGPKTEQQLREVLRARGISKCEARGRTRVIPQEVTSVAAAAPQLVDGVPSAQKVEDPAAVEREKQRAAEEAAALERERQRVWDEAKKREADRVAAENRAAVEAKQRQDAEVREAASKESEKEAKQKANEIRNRGLLRKANAAERAQITRAVQRSVIDPTSVLVEEIFVVPGKNACVAVNGKNRFGGYTGFKPMIVSQIGGEWHSIMALEVSMLECIPVILKLS